MIDFIYIVGSFVVGLVFSTKVRWFCEERGVMNEVTARSSHEKPTPRGGGLAIVFMIIPAGLALTLFTSMPHKHFMLALLFTAALVAGMGWLDDIKSRPVWLRLIVQAGCVAACLSFLPPVFDFMPFWVEKVLMFFAWIWFVNLFNFMDGIDGITGVETIFIALILSFMFIEIKPVLLVLIGSTLGFLRLNWHPAKIFMGDVGSMFLGFLLGGLMLLNTSMETLFPLLTLTLIFTADPTYTLLKRLLQGKKPWKAHKEHWYQRAVQAGLSHSHVVRWVILINFILSILTIVGWQLHWGPFGLLFGLIVVSIAAWRIRWLEGK